MEWTQEKINLVFKYKKEGKSDAFIARILGTTRNAVIGKRHRLNKKTETPIVRGRPYLAELSYSSWSSHRYKPEEFS